MLTDHASQRVTIGKLYNKAVMGKIKNFAELAVTPERNAALEIAEAGLAAIDTGVVIRKWVKEERGAVSIGDEIIRKEEYDRLFVVGIGKCALDAGAALEVILGDTITDGIILDVREGQLKKIRTYAGTHPFPTEANVDATAEIIDLLARCTSKDIVLFIISGGGSALLCQPRNLTCVEETKLLKYLFEEGATIEEINVLRKRLSLAHGGHLAVSAYPARVISLIFSDVPGDDVQYIASGPTVMDTTTIEDAKTVIRKYDLEKHSGFAIELIETPKDAKYFEKVKNIIAVSNTTALRAMEEKARQSGFFPKVVSSVLQGEAREVGMNIVKELRTASPKTVLLYGGETTVTIKGNGKGGRNQELALGALEALKSGEVMLSLASDGRDDTDYAGALCDTMTKEKAERQKLRAEVFLARNDSYGFFERVGDALVTGATGSNVSDLIVALKNF